MYGLYPAGMLVKVAVIEVEVQETVMKPLVPAVVKACVGNCHALKLLDK